MKRNSVKTIIAMLCLAVMMMSVAACADKTPVVVPPVKVEPTLAVTADLLDSPTVISMGDYELKSVKFGERTLESFEYTLSNGQLLFLCDSYGEYGIGQVKFKLGFDNNVEKELVITVKNEKISSDTLMKNIGKADATGKNYVINQGGVADDEGATQNAYRFFNNVASLKDNSRAFIIKKEFYTNSSATHIAFKYLIPENSKVDNSAIVKIGEYKDNSWNAENVSDVQLSVLGKWTDIKCDITNLTGDFAFMPDGKEFYIASVKAESNDPFIKNSGAVANSANNSIEKVKQVADKNGLKFDGYLLNNFDAANQGDNRAFYLKQAFWKDEAKQNDIMTFKYFIPEDSGYGTSLEAYICSSTDGVFSWAPGFASLNTYGVWTEYSINLVSATQDLGFLLGGYKFYIADIRFANDDLFDNMIVTNAPDTIVYNSDVGDNNNAHKGCYVFTNLESYGGYIFYIAREYFVGKTTISFDYYIADAADSITEGNWNVGFYDYNRNTGALEPGLAIASTHGTWTHMSLDISGLVGDFGLALSASSICLANVTFA